MISSLYTPFKKWSSGGSVYLYSDPHFADEEIKYIRNNISDEEQVKRINSVVTPNDTLIMLGDIGDVSFVSKLRGYKVLIMGNHDKGRSNYVLKTEVIIYDNLEEAQKAQAQGEVDVYDFKFEPPYYFGLKNNHLFNEVYEGPLMISDRIILSHEPLPNIPWALNIHGHDHSDWEGYNDGLHINVCAEFIDWKPVNLMNVIKVGRLKNIPSIHRLTIDRATNRNKEDNA